VDGAGTCLCADGRPAQAKRARHPPLHLCAYVRWFGYACIYLTVELFVACARSVQSSVCAHTLPCPYASHHCMCLGLQGRLAATQNSYVKHAAIVCCGPGSFSCLMMVRVVQLSTQFFGLYC
jgi:hypothetical protein